MCVVNFARVLLFSVIQFVHFGPSTWQNYLTTHKHSFLCGRQINFKAFHMHTALCCQSIGLLCTSIPHLIIIIWIELYFHSIYYVHMLVYALLGNFKLSNDMQNNAHKHWTTETGKVVCTATKLVMQNKRKEKKMKWNTQRLLDFVELVEFSTLKFRMSLFSQIIRAHRARFYAKQRQRERKREKHNIK